MTRSLLALALLGAGCGGSLPEQCEDGHCQTQTWWQEPYQENINRRIDLLFVIDDSPAMAPYAATLAAGLADMARSLEGLPKFDPASLHVGVIRAGQCDQSTRGAACGITASEQFLSAELCQTRTNYPGTLADGLVCLGDLGTANCGPAHPLAAAASALAAPRRPGWTEFLRRDAYLMVVVIAAADDASELSVVDYAAFIKGLKSDPSQTLASVIVPSICATAYPERLIGFAQQFGANGLMLDLCQSPLAPALQRLTYTISSSLLPPCARSVRDTDLDTPGLQADCVFEDHMIQPDGSWTSTALPSCDVASPPCWRMTAGGANSNCDGYSVSVERGADWCAESGTNITIECLGCTDANDPACAVAR